jgi:3-hydroxyacyl-CoA dehydrogenase
MPMVEIIRGVHTADDTVLRSLDVIYAELNDGKYRPCPLLKKMVSAGRVGRKSGRGFYEYGAGTPDFTAETFSDLVCRAFRGPITSNGRFSSS